MFPTLRHLPVWTRALPCLAVLALAAACGGTGEPEQPTPVVVPTVAQAPSLPVKLAEIVTPTPLPAAPKPSPTAETEGTPEAGYKPESNMYRFFSRINHPVKVALEGLERARTHKDSTQVPIILEVLRFFPSQQFQEEALDTLNRLTGQPPEGEEWTWNRWMAWLWDNSSDYPVPDNYATWKSVFLSGGIDQRYREFLPTDGKVAPDIDLVELIWGGIAPDQTPPLVDPEVTMVEEADYLLPDDRVFGVSIDGEHRAYPLRITNIHEIVNDEIAGRPIVLAQCVLCGVGRRLLRGGGRRENPVRHVRPDIQEQPSDVRPGEQDAVAPLHGRAGRRVGGRPRQSPGADPVGRDDLEGVVDTAPGHHGPHDTERDIPPERVLAGVDAGLAAGDIP